MLFDGHGDTQALLVGCIGVEILTEKKLKIMTKAHVSAFLLVYLHIECFTKIL